ncbi:MAG TPA: hypothetical protein DEG09_08360 [Marinilabiliaceae bacterium]|nr:hypothetical protein [Marinilabiliaceae bacterium]HBX88609.1 hypothetical protein [Marinilabiliaceae bacterium]
MRFSLIALLLLCLSNSVHAQKEFKPYSEYSLTGGASISQMFIPDVPGSFQFVGSSFGGRFSYFGEKILGIMLELRYSSLKGNEPDVSNLSYTYLHTPVMTRISVPFGKSALSVNLGSYVQFPLTYDSGLVMERNALLGLAGGLDFTFPVSRQFIAGVEGRYNYNLHSNSTSIDNLWASWIELGLVFTYSNKL